MNRYQWTVVFAAWLGWSFDIFDGLLLNYVAPNCVPTLLGLPIGSPEAQSATVFWAGLFTSILLIGWAIGGIVFGKVADRIGRTKTLLITMLLYGFGTGLCAFSPNIWILVLFRSIASLGIGGEWAAGAALVAEVVPEKWRIETGAFLHTSAPVGLFMATLLNYQISGVLLSGQPEVSWRYVLLFGLIPALVALGIRLFIKEPERWHKNASESTPPKIRELFNEKYFKLTLIGSSLSLIALFTAWCFNAFLPEISTELAQAFIVAEGLTQEAILAATEKWKTFVSTSFTLGSVIGTLLTIPAAKYLGRRMMFTSYFLLSAVSIMLTFGLNLSPNLRLYMFFPIGITVSGVFGSFPFYLTELFPTRLRATGAGFCYNIGRVVAAGGPFLVGALASIDSTAQALFWIGFVPLVGVCFMPWVIETKGQVLAD
jgi:MFS family permease